MINLKRKPIKVFARYLFSYLAILLVPLFVIGILGYNYIISINTEKIIHNDIDTLTEAVKSMDNQLVYLSQIASEISGNGDLWFDSDRGDIQKTLSGFSIKNKFVSEILFYKKSNSNIYSSKDSNRLSSVINFNSVSSITTPTLIPFEIEHCIMYVFPIQSFKQRSYATVTFIIPEKSVLSILNNILKGYRSNTVVLNPQDKIITFKKESVYYNKLLDYVKLKPEYSEIDTVLTKREGYYIAYSISGYSGLKYITITRAHEISSKVNRLKTTALYSLILIILIGGIAISYFLHSNYSPIKELKEFAEKRIENNKNNTDEIGTIKSVIEKISEQNIKLQTKVKSNEIAVKEYLLLKLLKGQIKSRDEFNTKGGEVGVLFSKPLLFVVIVHFDKLNELPTQDTLDLIKDLEHRMPEGIEGYGRESIDGKRLIFIMCTEENEDTIIVEHIIPFQKLLREKLHISSSIGIGNRYAKYREIGKSYIEASTAVDYRFVIGKNTIILFSDIKHNRTEIQSYPVKEFEELEKHILSGDIESIENIIIMIIGNIKNNNLPLFLIKSICFDIIGIIRKVLSNINEESSIKIEIFHDVMSLTEFTTVDDLYDLILTISTEICNLITEKKEYINLTLIDRIFHYIKNNYTDYNFSIQMIADYFEMSVTNFSYFFKSHAGCTFIEYTSNMHIEKAKNYLLDTDMPVKEIVKTIGYHDESSFIRKFRKIVGTTPGKFRNVSATL